MFWSRPTGEEVTLRQIVLDLDPPLERELPPPKPKPPVARRRHGPEKVGES